MAINLKLTEAQMDRLIDTSVRVTVNVIFAALFSYIAYLIVPSMTMAIGQFVTVLILSVRNAMASAAGRRMLLTAVPVQKEAQIKVNRFTAHIDWTDADGLASARPVPTKVQKAVLETQAGSTSVLIYAGTKPASTALSIKNIGLIPTTFAHSTLRPPSIWNVTNFLIAINTVCFVWSAGANLDNMQKMPTFALINAGASLGVIDQPWRLFSSCFLHIAWWHLLFNMIGLVVFGYICEGKLGRWRYVFLYFFCCLGGSLASAAAFGGTTSAAGASGAIMGLGGFITALAFGRRDLYRSIVVRQILNTNTDIAIIALLYGFFCIDFMSGSLTDNAGHAGGFIFGILAAWIIPARTSWKGRTVALTITLVASLACWTIAWQKYYEDGAHGARAILAMAQGKRTTAEAEFKLALAAENQSLTAENEHSNEHSKTTELLQKLLKIVGFDRKRKLADLYNSASWGQSSVGNFGEAIKLATRSLSYRADPATMDSRGVAEMGNGDYVAARADFEHALQLKPDYGAVQFHLAQLNMLDPAAAKLSHVHLKAGQRFDYDPEGWEIRFGRP